MATAQQQKAEKENSNAEVDSETLPILVEIKPGLADGTKYVPLVLQESDLTSKTVDEVIRHALDQESVKRKYKAVVDSVKKEMDRGDYKIVINGETAQKQDQISSYEATQKSTEDGEMRYRELVIVIADNQGGGLESKFRL